MQEPADPKGSQEVSLNSFSRGGVGGAVSTEVNLVEQLQLESS